MLPGPDDLWVLFLMFHFFPSILPLGSITQAGQFIIEYCGEVISWKEAKRRAQAYETQGTLLILGIGKPELMFFEHLCLIKLVK